MRDTTGQVCTTAGQGKLVAVVVTFNRLEQLQVTLDALLASPPEHLESVVIVDNASKDGTAAWLATLDDPRLDIVLSKKNLGGSGGFALGMRRAIEFHDPDWLVVMDDDGRPEADAFEKFHASDLEGIDGVAAAVHHPDGAICEMNRPAYHPFWKKSVLAKTAFGGGLDATRLGPDAYNNEEPMPIHGASFVGFFVRASAVSGHGYPDPDLFIYGDDIIYTFQLTGAGNKLIFDPSIRFEHDNSTYRVAFTRIRPMWKVYYYYRNVLLICFFVNWWSFVPVVFWLIPKWLLSVRHYGRDWHVFLRLYALAVWDGMRRRTGRSHESILAIAKGPVTVAAIRGDTAAARASQATTE